MKYNRLTIIKEDVGRTKHKKRLCLCRCDCGKEVIKIITEVKSGHVKSCGCLIKEGGSLPKHSHSIHGTSPTYQSWRAMKQRCYCPNNKDYHNYGGKGIIVCEEWKDSFIQFLSDMGVRPSKDYSLDRIDPNKNYCPSNCQWILKTENSRKGNLQRRKQIER